MYQAEKKKILKDQKKIGKILKWRKSLFGVRLLYRDYNTYFIYCRGIWYTSVDWKNSFENIILPYSDSKTIDVAHREGMRNFAYNSSTASRKYVYCTLADYNKLNN